MPADAAEGADAAGGEELGDADAAGLAPVGAGGGEGDVGAAEGEMVDGDGMGAAGEGVVVGAEDVAGEAGGGDDEGGDPAELEVEEGAVLGGHAGEG